MERSSVYEDAIWRVETTPGADDGTYYRLFGSDVMTDIEMMIRTFKKTGSKFSTSSSVGKEHSSGKINGDQSFNDLLFLSRGLLTKGVVTTPSNNGIYTLGVGAASGGTLTLTYGGQTTTAIAYNASAAAIKSALVALSSIASVDLVSVTGSATPWTIELLGSLSVGGALTGSGASLTGGTFTLTSTTATNTRRWTITSLYNTADDPQTFVIQRGATGIADQACKVPMCYISGLSFKWTPQEATFSGDLFGDETTDPFTMETSGITNITCIPVDPACMSVWVGDHISGATGRQLKLSRLMDLELNISGKWNPLKTINCSDAGITAGVEAAPTSDVKFTISHNDQSQDILAKVRVGDIQYMTFEALAPSASIETGYRHRFWWTAPLLITKVSKSDSDGLYVATYDAVIQYQSEADYAIKMIFDTTYASF